MTDFNFISANETRKALFYQLPKVLFESDKYMKMSNDSNKMTGLIKTEIYILSSLPPS